MAKLNHLFCYPALGKVLAIASLTILALPSLALYNPPSNLRRPGGRQGAATRTDCTKTNFMFAPLVPVSNYGQTIAAYPTLYWYHANDTFTWGKFELFSAQQNTLQLDPDPLYQTTFRIQPGTTLASLTIPETVGLPPLKVGQDYKWKVTLICSARGPDDETAAGSQRSVQGWIQRVEPSAKLKAKLNRTKDPFRYDIYAEEGLWYDAIHDLAVQHQKLPHAVRLMKDWQSLLQETSLKSLGLN